MKIEKAMYIAMREIPCAGEIHPNWPTDVVRAGVAAAEDAGGPIQACGNFDGNPDAGGTMMMTEAVHTAETAIRFSKNMEE